MVRSSSIFRLLLTFLFAYLFSFGATFSGVVLPELKFFNLILLGVVLGGWLCIHYQRKWTWHTSKFEIVLGLWAVAIIVSLLANLETWRRITIGVWFVVLYVLIWYLLHDALSNRAIDRDTIIDAMLMGSLIVVILGYVQLSTVSFDLTQFELPRPGSTIGNPNSFGAFLIAIFPFSLARTILIKNRLAKIVLGIYSLALLFLLFLTFSRGAWFGGTTALIVMGYLYLQQRDLLNFDRLREGWISLNPRAKIMISGAIITVILITMIGALLVIDSFSTGGRETSLRTDIYAIAIDLTLEQPLTGHGLFTFGQGYERLQSIPSNQPHSHAHNIILNVLAELGLIGLIAITGTVWVTLRMIRSNWANVSERQRPALLGAISAVAGFGVHHLLDTPAMMPVIAIVGLLALTIATTPMNVDIAISGGRGQLLRHLIPMTLTIILLVSGFWSANVYQTYWNGMLLASEDNGRDFLGGATAIQDAINADPDLALYHSQQGFLYGIHVSENDDPEALQSAIEAYEQFLELEPQSAIGWTNLAGLYWQGGQQDQAVIAMREAVDLAPDAWQLHLNLGRFAEENGNGDLARQAYVEALNASTYTLRFWQETELRLDVWASFEPTGFNRVQEAILNNETLTMEEVNTLWQESGRVSRDRTDRYVLELLLQLLTDSPQNVEQLLENAESQVTTESDRAYVHIGRAYLARYQGNLTLFETEMRRAEEIANGDILSGDFANGVNIAFLQYLRFGISRQFLPQIYYPSVDIFLLRLLDQ